MDISPERKLMQNKSVKDDEFHWSQSTEASPFQVAKTSRLLLGGDNLDECENTPHSDDQSNHSCSLQLDADAVKFFETVLDKLPDSACARDDLDTHDDTVPRQKRKEHDNFPSPSTHHMNQGADFDSDGEPPSKRVRWSNNTHVKPDVNLQSHCVRADDCGEMHLTDGVNYNHSHTSLMTKTNAGDGDNHFARKTSSDTSNHLYEALCLFESVQVTMCQLINVIELIKGNLQGALDVQDT